MALTDFWSLSYYGNTMLEYATALAITLVLSLLIWLAKKVFVWRFRKFARKTKSKVDDVALEIIEKFKWPFYATISFYIGVHFLEVSGSVMFAIDKIVMVIVTIYAVLAITRAIDFGTNKFRKKTGRSGASKLLGQIFKFLVWVIAIVWIVSNFGYNVAGLLAGLGIGGVAIAFAVQNILEDIFASFSIHADEPFEVGDFIVVGDDKGTVKKIGVKSTRVETWQGEELVIPNKNLTESRVHNFRKMNERRSSLSFGVSCETQVKKLRKIPDIVAGVMEGMEHATLHNIHLRELGDFTYDYKLVFFMDTDDYKIFLDTQQEIILRILERFEEEGIVLPYPTQNILIHKDK